MVSTMIKDRQCHNQEGNSDQVLCSDYEQCSKSLQCRPAPPPRGAGAQEATEAPSGPSRRLSLQMQPLTFKLRDGLLVMALESPLQGPVPGDQRFSETLNYLCSISGGQHPHVAENGVWLLSPWKPVKRPGWWKEKLAFFQKTATWEDGLLSKDQLSPTDNQWARAFIDGGKGSMQKQHSQLCHLEIGYHWSDLHHLDCFRDS